MKKLNKIILILIFVLNIFIFPIDVKAETLGDLKRKLDNLLEKSKNNTDNIKQTEEEQKNTNRKISQIYIDMTNISNEIIEKSNEISKLEEDIVKKDAEIKDLMKSYQITMGDSFYLEYIFGAESITDFIYRYSITEQITKNNNQLIEDMNNKIEENKQRNKELEQKNIELKDRQADLGVKLKSLGSEKKSLEETQTSLEEEIKNSMDVIEMYKKAGCEDNEDINVCANKLLPPDTSFYRPLITGYISSEFSWRKNPITGEDESHTGIDMSNSYGAGYQVRAAANGLVAKIYWPGGYPKLNCGSWWVVIYHKVNGQRYTSLYLHMSKVLVKEGQTVTKDTVIGIMGGARGTDQCSTGAHLHLSIAYGHWYTESDYTSYSSFKAHLINPRQVTNFPSNKYVYWYDRTTKYYDPLYRS